jgi:ribonucleoside-diphosphate reductase alpha chain
MSTTHSTTSSDRGHLQAVGGRGRREDTGRGASRSERVFTGGAISSTRCVGLRSAVTGEGGEVVFEQRDVEIPKSWSQLAANVVVSKYFRGNLDAPDRERSVKQLIGRVVGKIREWGDASGYFATPSDSQAFADELTHVLVTQRMAFNSPVWFNLGVKDTPQQASACFINSVDDTMESIMDLAKTEAMLFKGGSGTGSGFRGSLVTERLAGGGSLGPVCAAERVLRAWSSRAQERRAGW